MFTDDSTIHTETSTVLSVEDYDQQMLDNPENEAKPPTEIELQPAPDHLAIPSPVANETSSRVGTPLLRPSSSVSSSAAIRFEADSITRSSSMPHRREPSK